MDLLSMPSGKDLRNSTLEELGFIIRSREGGCLPGGTTVHIRKEAVEGSYPRLWVLLG